MTKIIVKVLEIVTEFGSFGRITSKDLIPFVGKTITLDIKKINEKDSRRCLNYLAIRNIGPGYMEKKV